MANQESPLVKRLTFRLPVPLWRHLQYEAKRRNMELGELLRFILNEEMLRKPLMQEEANAIEQEFKLLLASKR